MTLLVTYKDVKDFDHRLEISDEAKQKKLVQRLWDFAQAEKRPHSLVVEHDHGIIVIPTAEPCYLDLVP